VWLGEHLAESLVLRGDSTAEAPRDQNVDEMDVFSPSQRRRENIMSSLLAKRMGCSP